MKFNNKENFVFEVNDEYSDTNMKSLSNFTALDNTIITKFKSDLSIFSNNITYLYNQSNTAILTENVNQSIWILENISINSQLHYEVAFNNTGLLDNINFHVYSESMENLISIIPRRVNTDTLLTGSFFTEDSNRWYFIINVTNPLTIAPTEYTLKIFEQSEGINIENAIKINDEDINGLSYYSYLERVNFIEKINYSSNFYFDSIFFSYQIHSNQRVWITFEEETQNVLEDAKVNLYAPRLNNPPGIVYFTNESSSIDGLDGIIEMNWIPFSPVNLLNPIDEYWIELILQEPVKGNFSLEVEYQDNGYAFDTAINIPVNSSIIDSHEVNYVDVYDNIRYYKFDVNQSGIQLKFIVDDHGSGSINNAIARIFDSGKNEPLLIVDEFYSYENGKLNGSFYIENTGIYYIELDLSKTQNRETPFEISISYTIPSPFVWSIDNIIVTLFCLILLPTIILAYDLYLGKKNHYWDVPGPKKSVYRFISENPRFRDRSEVPSEKMMFVLPYYLGTIILEFTSPSEESTSICLTNSNKSALRFFYYLPIGISVYWIINLLKFMSNRTTALWFHTQDSTGFSIIIIFLLLLTGIPALLVLIFRYNYIDLIKKELDFSISSYITQSLKEISSDRQITIEDANKMLSYVRVLWNQAKKAFKGKNYSLFIIKADSAVKKLIELRFLQLMGYVADKLTFEEIIEKLRENAFDVPSSKKIEYFRKVRNKVVHSSHLLEEKTAIETFSYYNKFLTRLGLRT